MPRGGKSNNGKTANNGLPCTYCTNSTAPEEAVTCYKCGETAHCYCAGVSMKEFGDITESSPYTCRTCLKATYLETISEMKDTIAALQLEVSELCLALSTLSCKQQQQEADSQKSTGQNVQDAPRCTGWADVVRHSKGRPNRQQQRNPCPHSWSKKTFKVWGTHSNATVGEVEGAISMLANLHADDLTVKLEEVKNGAGLQETYKVVVCPKSRGKHPKRLEETWSTMAFPRRWKIEPMLCYTDNETLQPQTQSCNTTDQLNTTVPISINHPIDPPLSQSLPNSL